LQCNRVAPLIGQTPVKDRASVIVHEPIKQLISDSTDFERKNKVNKRTTYLIGEEFLSNDQLIY
jgi:hypothetical protein